jgi:eukaryotic-like serine/threonine-protein kinase
MNQGGDHPGGRPGSGSTLPAVGGSAPSGGDQAGGPNAASSSARGDEMIGQVIDNRYRIINKLGEGGMGEVYAAEHVHIEKRVAIKLLRSEIITNEQAVIRFRREAKETSSIGHRNIIAIEDFGTLPDGRIYLAMELLAGLPLNEMLHAAATGQAPLDAGRLLHIIIQTGHGLAAAHQKGIVHRDMKPENVFITTGADGQDVPKILDFGIAKVSGADGNNHLTQTGTIFGTPYYMAPEQALGQQVDHRADIYAVGVIMYECFTGALPFVGESFMGILTQHITAEPQPPSEAARGQGRELHPGIENIIVRAMKKDANERYQSMDELIEALVAVYRQISGPGMSTFLEAQPTPGSMPMGAVGSPAPTPQPYVPQPTPAPYAPGPHESTPLPYAPTGQSAVYGVPPSEPRKRGKGGLIAAALAVVLVGGGGAGAFAYFGGQSGEDDEGGEAVAEVAGSDTGSDTAEQPSNVEDDDTVIEQVVGEDAGAGEAQAVADFDAAVEQVAGAAQVIVNSRPQGAMVFHGDEQLGPTPLLVNVPAGETLELVLRRQGRQPATLRIDGSEERVDATLAAIPRQQTPGDRQGGEQPPEREPDKPACDPAKNPACLLE